MTLSCLLCGVCDARVRGTTPNIAPSVDLGLVSHKQQLKQMCGGKDGELAVDLRDVTAVVLIHRMATTRKQNIFNRNVFVVFLQVVVSIPSPDFFANTTCMLELRSLREGAPGRRMY